jgi:hypothetical protein
MKRISVAAIVLLLNLACFHSGLAHCDQTAVSSADQDLWDTHGCIEAVFLWHYRAYDLREDDWNDRGWDDACNDDKEFAKHWNASFLITYGLLDNYAQSFHGTVDYRAAAERYGSDFHDRLYHTATDDQGIFGRYSHHIIGPNEISVSCLRFEGGPAERAADFMHEGWHAWQDKHDYDGGPAGGHQHCTTQPDGSCRNGNCTIDGCDYFYFHGISAYLFGDMWQDDGTANRFHSPNQVQVEFQCDVADQPQPWIPASVRQGARAETNARSAERFINGPGYICGDSRPW